MCLQTMAPFATSLMIKGDFFRKVTAKCADRIVSLTKTTENDYHKIFKTPKDKLLTNPCTAHSDELLCNGCSQCANVCPYGAITYEEKEVNDHGIREVRRIAVVNDALCQGCGACTVTCPSGAMDLQGFSNRQILAEVDAICR